MHTHSLEELSVALQGSFKGKEKKSTTVLEVISEQHLWFWQLSYGYAGTLNDLNILDLSPFLESLVNEKFPAAESDAGVVPFYIGDHEFQKLFPLVYGIYPKYNRFVCALKEPLTNVERALLDGKNLAGRMLRVRLEFCMENFIAWQDSSTPWT